MVSFHSKCDAYLTKQSSSPTPPPASAHRAWPKACCPGGIAHIDHRHQLIALGAREDVSQQGRVERADPKGGQAFVLRRRRNPPSFQDPVHLLLLHPLRRKCAAGVAAIQYVI